MWNKFVIAEVDEDDEEEDEEAEDGYEDIVADRDKAYKFEEGPSARDIEDRMRRKDLWEWVYLIYSDFVEQLFTVINI